ncbi:MAG: prepilin-type N-terminal cleavage/methylation domain-containing protein [bacterium]|nr:prepilin-type N-terminal cleavage/methylation domain-containing protein [bacterium]
MIKETSTKNKGFTLVEAMVAISILSLAVTGPLVIAQKGIGSAVYARDQITASYLAQEAVEYVRNVRDTNRIEGDPWLTNLFNCLETGAGQRCTIDARFKDPSVEGAITACPPGLCPILMIGTEHNLYGYGTGEGWRATPFTRTVYVDNRIFDREAMVSVTVEWSTSLFAPKRTFTVKEYLLDF